MDNGLSGYHRQHSPIHPFIDQILVSWPQEQRNTVYLLINKYGLPNDASMTKITWYNNGPWKRTIVHLHTVPHNSPTPHLDYLEQTINYKVPVQSFDDIARFDGSLYPDRTAGEATAKCDQEAANFMVLNLMNDMVTGKRTVEDARRAAAEMEKAFRLHGQYPPYTTGFLFPKQSHTADPDVASF
ncbi:hypothetical protein SAMN04487897_13432 [Paenibacillus sp. yr247]|uniref:hypothetical protein n=1 Tax=Paenibacillus sp. yr247 TaxID=1761880 RepID=UPI0008892171|nr:hypothetical protein [Paenibacillus sp. yr247]SDP07322.1 hypothetical protein SAMN04487897_13432 [Paenibacillus sp. yr247]